MALLVLVLVCFVLVFAQAAMAITTDGPVGGVSQTGSSGSSSGSSTPGTGAEVAVFGIAGASLLGAGYFMTKKSKA